MDILQAQGLFFNQFQQDHFRGIAETWSEFQHPGITTGTLAIARAKIVKEFFDGIGCIA